MSIAKKIILSAVMMGACLVSSSFASEQRYISIRNTDNVWVPGNICSLQFRLDNGGSGEGFGSLAITLRLKDKGGNVLSEGVMNVKPFGDSDAARSQDAFLEGECQDDTSTIEVVKATESRNGKEVNLPLSIFDPQYYNPLPVTVKGHK
ncbi:hypothetical protein ZV82_001889 [Salmonella enterica subsp. enterica]|nr:hypothetical protein [Salmonella enterica subsp. enterica]